jgi:hypothetical protein
MSCVLGLYVIVGIGLYGGYRHWGTPLRMLYAALFPLHWAVVALVSFLSRHGRTVGVVIARVVCAALLGGASFLVAVLCWGSGDVLFAAAFAGFGLWAAKSLLVNGITRRERLL